MVAHAAEVKGLFQRGQQLAHGKAVITFGLVSRRPAAGADHAQHPFAAQRFPLRTVGPAMFQYQVLPLFEEGWRAIPIKGVLQDDQIMVGQQLLFTGNVDVKIRISLVEIIQGDARQLGQAAQQLAMNARLFQRRMGKQNQDASHSAAIILLWTELVKQKLVRTLLLLLYRLLPRLTVT